jgi:hypothetical protein
LTLALPHQKRITIGRVLAPEIFKNHNEFALNLFKEDFSCTSLFHFAAPLYW